MDSLRSDTVDMKKALFATATLLAGVAAFQNCGGFQAPSTGSSASSLAAPTPTPTSYPGNLSRGFNAGLSGPNIIPVTVGSCGFGVPNTACVSVTICEPNTKNCQTIPNIQLSTSDTGLRIFSSVLTLTLPDVTVSGNTVGDCDTATVTPLWGPVRNAEVTLGGEPAVSTPIQIIDSAFATPPSACSGSATSPSEWGANGVLGVGLPMYDCGPYCEATVANGVYFTCPGGSCASVQVDIHSQIANPVALLPTDNNGVAITLPAIVNHAGTSPVSGSLILGIGTQANNTPLGAVGLVTDDNGLVQANLGGKTYPAFFEILDNLNHFPNPMGLTACSESSAWSSYFCPSSEQSLSLTFSDKVDSQTIDAILEVGNAYNEANSSTSHVVWDDVGVTDGSYVVLGSDFFFGKTIYVGLEGLQSPLGIGPYFGF